MGKGKKAGESEGNGEERGERVRGSGEEERGKSGGLM